ncbi:MAG: Gfo/Idh/MocA family oxidoreductase [Phycisphaerae bacterium]|nr:Gfo/Idh/MocA family oxidoreductase [Phycisphaerae bacterium]
MGNDQLSRRNFMKTSASVIALTAMSSKNIFAAGDEKIKIGLIGAGGRGTGAAINCLEASPDVEIVAMCDLFKDRVDGSLNRLKKDFADRVKVTPETTFTGFDGAQKVLDSGIDMVILACPPGFRPRHLEMAVNAGKHVFMEKPVATDPAGIRKVIAASKLAETKKLSIVAGTQRRHQKHYIDIIRQVEAGVIGEPVAGQCFWNGGELWHRGKEASWTEMEYQCRNWLYFTWLSGDHIVEQHVHNIDVCNWAMGGHPVKAYGMGGRQKRTDPKWGNIWDHFAIEFEYENGAKVMSMCRQSSGCSNRVSEYIVGTKGRIATNGSNGQILIDGKKTNFDGSPNPYVQEHKDLVASIKGGQYLNEGVRVAESTMTAILGRMSAYTGREIKFDWALNASKLELVPQNPVLGDLEERPVAIPGITKMI